MISNKLVKQYGGKFSVDSSPGEGSTFTFTFKLSENDQNDVQPINKLTGGKLVAINSKKLDFSWLPKYGDYSNFKYTKTRT